MFLNLQRGTEEMDESGNSPIVLRYSKSTMNWFKKNFISIVVICLVIALSVVLFLFRTEVKQLNNFGYLGAFLISLVSSLTIILPVPGFYLLIPLAAIFNPVLVAVAASTGGIVGELAGYAAGRSGRHILANNKQYKRAESWMKRWGVWAIMFFAFVPLVPFDVAGLVSGALRYPVWKFMLAGWVGKTAKFIILLLFSSWAIKFLPFM
jgi:membrane protein YqaA with SNARE-associated domain